MMQDKLTICPRCGSDACYQQDLNAEYTIHQCYGCGFTTNTLMTTDSEFLEEQLEVLPELYKDLAFVDKEERVWIPSATNLMEQGMVYADGKSKFDWQWSAVKAVPISEEEKEKYPIPGEEGKYYKYKMGTESQKNYKERDVMEVLDYMGVFNGKQE